MELADSVERKSQGCGKHKMKKTTRHLTIFAIIAIFFLLLLAYQSTNNEKKTVRPAAVAGTWYPGEKEALDTSVNKYLDNVPKARLNGTIKAVIVPHAGYRFSGQVAAVAFKQLEDIYDKVILLGPSHHYPLEKASILDVTHYQTPLGEIRLSEETKQLSEEDIISTVKEAHDKEHALEIELPFLQKTLTDFELIPIVVGAINPEEFKETLLKHIDEKTLIVVSVDLSHYHKYEEAQQLDYYTIDRILSRDSEKILQTEIDAPWAVSTLLKIAKTKGWKPYLLYYANSGDITGDKERVVGYAAMVFVDKEQDEQSTEPLNEKEQELLLTLARYTAEQYLETGKIPQVDETKLTPSLKKVQGCFTTFNKDQNLRGCIGHILPQEELYKCVMDNAVNAAVNDARFQPVTLEEMKEIDIEISVLTVPQKLEFESGNDLTNKLTPMVDGVVLKQGFKQSTYLPQVWANFESKDQFLTSLCRKGGMSLNCWQDTNTEVFTYQAFVFEEPTGETIG